MTAIQTVSQSLQPDGIVSLFTLDVSSIGGPVLNFVQGSETSGANISFNSTTYYALDCEFTGLETTGVGALPTPHIKVANQDGIFQSILNTYGDVLGCPLYRLRTYERYLDGRPTADPEAFFGPDTFRVERLVTETSVLLEWELSAAIDQEGKQLPGRQVIRDTCLWRYRSWNAKTGTFDYSHAQCPYVGAQAYDINNLPISDKSKDVCSRRISGCEARFGKGNPLPFGGFPGVARVRQ